MIIYAMEVSIKDPTSLDFFKVVLLSVFFNREEFSESVVSAAAAILTATYNDLDSVHSTICNPAPTLRKEYL